MPKDPTYLTREDEYREQQANEAETALYHYNVCQPQVLGLITALKQAGKGKFNTKPQIIITIIEVLDSIEWNVFMDVIGYEKRKEAAEYMFEEETYIGMKQRMDDLFHNTLKELREGAGL